MMWFIGKLLAIQGMASFVLYLFQFPKLLEIAAFVASRCRKPLIDAFYAPVDAVGEAQLCVSCYLLYISSFTLGCSLVLISLI